jgi:hypothetical protein
MTVLRLFIGSLVAIFLVFQPVGSTLAENVPDLYVTEVPVAGQGAKARSAAIKKAFAKVLVKVSGDRDLSRQGGMQKVLGRADSYVRQYSYRMLKPRENAADANAAKQASPDRLLRVSFDEQVVNRQLRQQGIPVWGSARPSTLIWLGIEKRGNRTLYQPENEQGLRNRLQRTARDRGLPIIFPLMDLEDSSNLQVSDLWGGFEERIRHASDRYLPDVILAGRLHRRGNNDWTADWSLYQPGEVSNWQTQASSKQAVAVEGLQRAVDRLAARFAPRYAEQGTTSLRIRVSGLNNLADFAMVKSYLQSLGLIEQLDLLAAHPESISFIARVQGGRDALERGIMLGGVLEPVVSADEVVSADAMSPAAMDAESLDFRLR